jgi:PAS domain S-box-containing protein
MVKPMISVLYVDDESILLDIGKIFLEKTGDFSVTTIDSAPAALALLETEKFDAIISDYLMPDMDGLEFLKQVRLHHGQIPFILFTGRGREEVVILALNSGADYYLQKGGNAQAQFAELSHKILTAVERRSTERAFREKQRQVEEREQDYRSILENIQDAYYRSDTEGNMILASPSLASLLGYADVAELYGKRLAQTLYYNPGDREKVLADIRKNGAVTNYEVTLKKQDGTPVIISTSSHEYYDADGNYLGVEGIFRDITDRKQAEESLRQSENLYRTIFNNTGTATIIIAPDTTILLANEGWVRLTGVPRSEQENKKSWTVFIDPVDAEWMKEYHYARRNDPTLIPKVYECRLIDAKKTVHHCFVYVDLIPGSKNSVASLVDITARVHAEELYQTVFENTGTAMVILEEDTTIARINEEMEKTWGYLREEIEGKMTWPNLIAEEDREKMLEYHRLRRTMPESAPKQYEFRFIHKNGELRYASLAAAMIPGTGKSVISIRDITEIKSTEKALRDSEAIYQQLEAQLPDFVIIHEGETIVFVNDEGARLMGKTPEQIIGTSVLSYAVPAYHELIKKNMGLRYRGIAVEPYEIEIITPSGEHLWVVVRATRIPNRESPSTLTVLTDISERKRAEEALRESEAKYRAIIENMQDLFYRTDLDGTITMVSPTGVLQAGYNAPEDLVGRNISDRIYADPKEREQFLAVLKKKGMVSDYPLTLIAGDGTTRYVTASSHFYYDADGKVQGIEGILHDVTRRKLAEKALLLANQKLHLLSGITRHDINNKLTVLKGYLALLEEELPDPALNEHFSKTKTAAEQISSMIQFMQEYEEIGVTAPVWHAVRTLAGTAARDVPPGQITLKNDLPAGMEVFADPLIAKVFFNLLDNTGRYGGDDRAVRFSAEDRNEEKILVYEDNGTGVAASDKEKIFERGFGKNTGLGLALSREILHITGITIRETGDPGKGVRFEMTVPKGMWRVTSGK